MSPARHRPANRGADPGRLRGPARLLRGWAAAVVATLVAAGSHTLAGGTEPGHDAGPAPVVWILTLALAGPLCTALAGRALSWWRLGSAVASSQLLFHWLYSQSAALPGHPGGSVLSDHAAHAVHGAHAGQAGPAAHAALASPAAAASQPATAPGLGAGPLPGAETLQAADHPSLAMVAAHVLAAVATVLLLRRGEAMAARVVELAVGFVLHSPGARLARWVPAVRRPRLPSRPVAPVLRAGAVVSSALRLRGPPVPALSL
ncbi:MAG: hypothetical protein MOP51_2592 [Citricoccus sp.]|nr:hypothetical protein [Citricoccus sp. WCRC_4]